MKLQAVSYLTLWLSVPMAPVAAQGVQVGSAPYPTVTDECCSIRTRATG